MTTYTSRHLVEAITGAQFALIPQKRSLEGTGHMTVATRNYNEATGTINFPIPGASDIRKFIAGTFKTLKLVS
jgi:hypothetical protein